MKKTLFGILLAAALAGCATTANYEKILASWVGSNVDMLIASWGPPQSSADLSNGGKVLKYFSSNTTVTTQNYFGVWVSTPQTYSCQTLFTIDASGVITKWKWAGNSCKAYSSN